MSHLAEQKKASDAEIIDIYEEAVRNNATVGQYFCFHFVYELLKSIYM